MKRVLFIENRQKTLLYEEVSKRLLKKHEIYWLAQNHCFAPNTKNTFTIPYPKRRHQKQVNSIDLNDIITSDRQQAFFGKKRKGYFYYYYSEIDKYLDQIKPDVVFGESTAFHELITIQLCKEKNILYLNPSSCRYPSGRFSFYKFDTLDPFMGSKDEVTDAQIEKIVHQINNNEVTPDYMKIKKRGVVDRVKNQTLIFWAYAQGERYNTPSLFTKFFLERKRKKFKHKWDTISSGSEIQKRNVLYPLQMQPEANIDVWGRRYRDQLNTIKIIYNSLPPNTILYVKPNPKLKYEVTNDMIEFIKKTPRIIAIPSTLSMNKIIDDIDVVVTVTGTIAMERIFSEKPVITLVKTINNTVSNCIFADNKAELKDAINNGLCGKLVPSSKEKKDFLGKIIKKSYSGLISDPYSDQNCISTYNIDQLEKAFASVIEKIKNYDFSG
ncbi:MAG: hypothetical protein ACPGC2_00365 [Flavobacteriaceae bacterium]